MKPWIVLAFITGNLAILGFAVFGLYSTIAGFIITGVSLILLVITFILFFKSNGRAPD
jgi:hypothetical protein